MNNDIKKTKKHLKGLLIRLGIIAGIIITFFCLFGVHIYHGNNMITSLRDGELVIVGKYTKPLADRVVVYKHNNHIAIDCGSSKHDGRLAAICLDTGKEFYSPSDKKEEEDE